MFYKHQGIKLLKTNTYFRIMRNICRHSHAKINIDPEGEKFTLERGVKLGDQISAELFTCVLGIYINKTELQQHYTTLISRAENRAS